MLVIAVKEYGSAPRVTQEDRVAVSVEVMVQEVIAAHPVRNQKILSDHPLDI